MMDDLGDLYTTAKVSLEELADDLAFLTHEELIEFIMRIDELVGDWDFTKELHKRLKKEVKKLKGALHS